MKISSLQRARYEYTPKLPGMLRNGIADICVNEGAETQSVADQEKIKALFPNTYGKKEITFQKGQNTSEAKKQVVGVILSGGQAPGGTFSTVSKAVQADLSKIVSSNSMTNTSTNLETQVVSISSVLVEQNLKQKNNSLSLLMFVRNTASQL